MESLLSPLHMQRVAGEWRRQGLRVGLVPTMGYLHDGHLSLIRALRPRVDRLVVSIYVNPLQFGPNEDLSRYPRDAEGDALRCAEAGVDLLFMPNDLYPDGFSTAVSVHGLSEGFCGATRPGHFDGVATVVARLFGICGCEVAIFGEKDFQQLAVIRRMTLDLALPVEILGAPLVRDLDGLALSSRNVLLSAEERTRALSLARTLFILRRQYEAGEKTTRVLVEAARAALDVDRLEYLEIVDSNSLAPVERVVAPARVLVAAFVGRTRLIDNVGLQ